MLRPPDLPRLTLLSLLAWGIVILVPLRAAEEADADPLKVEAHGYVSFGHLRTWGNNWLGPTRDGSSEFWETAMNVTARPVDRLRLGSQLFARDLAQYDNGKVQLDLLYADYRLSDWLGLTAGRIRIPIGLFNESLDVDSARASIFQPPGIYALRARDLYISTDGAKVYGTAGGFEYAAFIGNKRYEPEGGVTTSFRQTSQPLVIDHLETAWMAGCMLHWNTPLPGLAARITLTNAHGVEISGSLPAAGATSLTKVDNYGWGVASLLYETGSFTWAGEYIRYYGHGETTFSPAISPAKETNDDTEGAYLSSTWHVRRWLEFYAAGEETVTTPSDRSSPHVYTTVLAVNVIPLPNWSLKAEFRDNHGTKGAYAIDNPEGIEKRWQALAFKTTVDF